jgi:hypothetical protein
MKILVKKMIENDLKESENNAILNILHCNAEDIISSHVSKWLTPESLKPAKEENEKITEYNGR